MSFDKKEYQRAYMRKKREKTLSGGVESRHAGRHGGAHPATDDPASSSSAVESESGSSAPPAQNNLPVPVLAEPERTPQKSALAMATRSGEARESTRSQNRVIPGEHEPRGGQSFSYDKKKYPNRGAWEIAVERVERAVCWAEKFPERIGPDDLKFQTLDWQYQNEGIKVSCK